VWNGIYHSDENFDLLKYKFRAIATDIGSAKTLSLKSGSLVTAMRASATIPIRNTPIRLDTMILIDGGVMANIPVEQAKEFNPDIIIAVNTTSPLMSKNELDKPWNLADQVVSLIMKTYSEKSGKLADILIEPDLTNVKNTEYSHIDNIIERGKISARKNLQTIQALINIKRDSLMRKMIGAVQSAQFIINFKGVKENNTKIIRGINELSSCIAEIYDLDKNIINKLTARFTANETATNVLLISDDYPKIKRISVDSHDTTISKKLNILLNANFLNGGYSQDLKQKITETVLKFYNSEGYSFTSLNKIEFDSLSGRMTVIVDEMKISSIKIFGNTKTKDFLVLREFPFQENKPLSANRAIEAWENLMSSGLFYDTDIIISHSEKPNGLEVKINVKEMPTQIISVSGRIDNERYTQGNLDLIQENLFNTGARLNGNISGGVRNFYGSLGFNFSRLFESLYTFSVNSYYKREDNFNYRPKYNLPFNRFENIRDGEYAEERYGMVTSIGSQIERKGIFYVGLRYERQREWTLGDSVRPPLLTIQTIKIGAIFDTENKTDFPTKGSNLAMSLETSLLQNPSITGFSKAQFSYRTNYSLGSYTLKPSVFFGFADATLPNPERFSLGGQESFFGLRENEYRGRQIALGSMEYRLKMPFQLFFDTYFSLRYDVGWIWLNVETIKFENLKHGAGMSFAIDTPLGPATFSLGKAFFFVKEPSTVVTGPLNAYFSIGMKI